MQNSWFIACKSMIYIRKMMWCTFQKLVNIFQIFSSPELKAIVSFLIAYRPSPVTSVCNHFSTRTTEQISPKIDTKHPLAKGIQVFSSEWPRSFPRRDNYELAKIYWRNLDIHILIQNYWTIFNQTRHNASLGKGD